MSETSGDERTRSDRGAAGARGVGDHPAVDAGRGPGHRRAGGRQAQRGRVDPRRTPGAGTPDDGHIADRLLAIPFRQVRERGFEAHDDGTPLVVVDVESEREFTVAEVVEAIDDTEVTFADRGGFETDDDEYAKLVEAVIADEIGQGEGANLVIGRHYRATVADWGADKALDRLQAAARARARRLLDLPVLHRRPLPDRRQPRAARHGARRRRADEPDQRHLPRLGRRWRPQRPRLLDFLHDEKEIYELFMVVDEELKMMCDICTEGGQVLGPFLKPMSRLIHTEYLLAGRTTRDPREVLRDTMYAATVTGSPVENACRLIKQYETEGRGYYGAALAILGRDAGRRAGRRQPDRDPYGGRRPRRAGSPSRPAPPWCATPTRRTRSPRPTPRRAASSAPSASYLPHPCRASTSPSWSTTRTCCSR